MLLRGFDNTYYTTTYDSREIFTAETRSVALQDFPSGAIAATRGVQDVDRRTWSSRGLPGLVNVRSRRPFDFKGLEVAGSAWALYPNQSRDATPNGNLLLTDRWRVGDGEMGALINFSYTKLHYQDSTRRHGFWIADLEGGRSPDYPEPHYDQGIRTRPSINGALQWRPSPGLELYAEGLRQGYRDKVSDNMWQQPLWAGASYDNLVFRDGTNEIVSGTVNQPGSCCGTAFAQGFQGATKRRTNTYQFAVGGSYDAGPLRAHRRPRADHEQVQAGGGERRFRARTRTIIRSIGLPACPAVPDRPSSSSAWMPATRQTIIIAAFTRAGRRPRATIGKGGWISNMIPILDFIPRSNGASATSTATRPTPSASAIRIRSHRGISIRRCPARL